MSNGEGFSGRQPQTLVVSEDDEMPWEYYSDVFDKMRGVAPDEIKPSDWFNLATKVGTTVFC